MKQTPWGRGIRKCWHWMYDKSVARPLEPAFGVLVTVAQSGSLRNVFGLVRPCIFCSPAANGGFANPGQATEIENESDVPHAILMQGPQAVSRQRVRLMVCVFRTKYEVVKPQGELPGVESVGPSRG